MNLLHKLVITLLFAACATGLSAQGEQAEQAATQPFSLAAFLDADKYEQREMITALLLNRELSDAKIAQELGLSEKEVAAARTDAAVAAARTDAAVAAARKFAGKESDQKYVEECFAKALSNDIVNAVKTKYVTLNPNNSHLACISCIWTHGFLTASALGYVYLYCGGRDMLIRMLRLPLQILGEDQKEKARYKQLYDHNQRLADKLNAPKKWFWRLRPAE